MAGRDKKDTPGYGGVNQIFANPSHGEDPSNQYAGRTGSGDSNLRDDCESIRKKLNPCAVSSQRRLMYPHAHLSVVGENR